MNKSDIQEQLRAAKNSGKDTTQLAVVTASSIAVLGGIAIASITYFSGPKSLPTTERVEDINCVSTNSDFEECLENPLRLQFIDAAKVYEVEIAPKLQNISLPKWNKASSDEIDTLHTDAIAKFETLAYSTATKLIESAIEKAEREISTAAIKFTENFADAKQALEDNEYLTAKAAIDMAMALDTGNQAAKLFAERVALMPEIISLLADVQRAKIENRPSVELKSLQQIVNLDSAREELKARISDLQFGATEAEYKRSILSAEQAIKRGDMSAAEKAIARAKKLFPSRDLTFVTSRIAAIRKTRKIDKLLHQAKQKRQQESWPQARSDYQKVIALDSSNQFAVSGLRISNLVIEGLAQTQEVLAKPLNLGTKKVADHAKAKIARFKDIRSESQQLNAHIQKIEQFLDQAAIRSRVTVISDGKTDIRVRGEGFVGKTKNRIIELFPGEYVLEGRRSGYHSAITKLTVGFNERDISTTLICSKKIGK